MSTVRNVAGTIRHLASAMVDTIGVIIYFDGLVLSGWTYSDPDALNPTQRQWRDWWMRHRPSVVRRFDHR